jgi:hypothetical protein
MMNGAGFSMSSITTNIHLAVGTDDSDDMHYIASKYQEHYALTEE